MLITGASSQGTPGSLYICPCMHMGIRLQLSVARMDRPHALQTGSAAGVSFAVVLKALQRFADTPVPVPPELYCPDLDSFHWPIFLAGVFVGLVIGPCLEGLVACRAFLYQAAFRRAALVWGAPSTGHCKLIRG